MRVSTKPISRRKSPKSDRDELCQVTKGGLVSIGNNGSESTKMKNKITNRNMYFEKNYWNNVFEYLREKIMYHESKSLQSERIGVL